MDRKIIGAMAAFLVALLMAQVAGAVYFDADSTGLADFSDIRDRISGAESGELIIDLGGVTYGIGNKIVVNDIHLTLNGTGGLENLPGNRNRAMFVVTGTGALTIDGSITLKGSENQNSPIVLVTGNELSTADHKATFTMEDGASVIGSERATFSAVKVTGSNAVFEMNGGTITGNCVCGTSANRVGGGVYVGEGGSFIMNGGSVTDNEARNGAGVRVALGGYFLMTGGEIFGNETHPETTFSSNGGGVSVKGYRSTDVDETIDATPDVKPDEYPGVKALFVMTGGKIYDNVANGTRTDQGIGGGLHALGEGTLVVINGGDIHSNDCGADGRGAQIAIADESKIAFVKGTVYDEPTKRSTTIYSLTNGENGAATIETDDCITMTVEETEDDTGYILTPYTLVETMKQLRDAIKNGEKNIVFDTSKFSDETIDRAEFRVGDHIVVKDFNLTITGNGTLSYDKQHLQDTMFIVSDGGNLVIDGPTIDKTTKTGPTVEVDSESTFKLISGTIRTNYNEEARAVDGDYVQSGGEIVVPGTVTVETMSALRDAIKNGEKNIVFNTSKFFDETVNRAEFRVGRVIPVNDLNLTITGNGTLSYDEQHLQDTMFNVTGGGTLIINGATIDKSTETKPSVIVDDDSTFELRSGAINTNYSEAEPAVCGDFKHTGGVINTTAGSFGPPIIEEDDEEEDPKDGDDEEEDPKDGDDEEEDPKDGDDNGTSTVWTPDNGTPGNDGNDPVTDKDESFVPLGDIENLYDGVTEDDGQPEGDGDGADTPVDSPDVKEDEVAPSSKIEGVDLNGSLRIVFSILLLLGGLYVIKRQML